MENSTGYASRRPSVVEMSRRRGKLSTRPRRSGKICVDGFVPNPEFDHELLPEQILGFAMDQRAFGPRQLMVAFAAYDGRFLALMYARRTDPADTAFEACLRHFEAVGRGGETHAAAVVLCDEMVENGPVPPSFVARFDRARDLAAMHRVHLVDWMACDDDLFRFARLRTFAPADDPDWWDVPAM